MNVKHFYVQLLLIGIAGLTVCFVSFQLSLYFGRRFNNPTISAGELLNYPFDQIDDETVVDELSVQPAPLPPVDHSQLFTDKPMTVLECEDCVTILVTGDVLTARSVNQKTTSLNDFTWPFQQTADFLRTADVTMINLETPLVRDCPVRIDGMVFCGDQRNTAGLHFAGIDVVNFANNHSGNQGKQGVTETLEVLTQEGFVVAGVEQPVYQIVKGKRFAYLGYNDVEKYGFIADVDEERMVSEITQAKQNADIVVVQFHWGEEYRYQPTARQRELGHLAIDLGADLVIGNHPHWIQPVEWYKDKLITYSHGNFVFDQMWSRETREGVVGRYVFQGKRLVDVSFFPILIEQYGQPRWLQGAEKHRILEIMRREGERLL
jgi:poly-gamma-glutamate capsule biosynthesis protein CapA/YwtB (metallophosphatase superfamily)